MRAAAAAPPRLSLSSRRGTRAAVPRPETPENKRQSRRRAARSWRSGSPRARRPLRLGPRARRTSARQRRRRVSRARRLPEWRRRPSASWRGDPACAVTDRSVGTTPRQERARSTPSIFSSAPRVRLPSDYPRRALRRCRAPPREDGGPHRPGGLLRSIVNGRRSSSAPVSLGISTSRPRGGAATRPAKTILTAP